MWNWIRRLFGGYDTEQQDDVVTEECQTDSSQNDVQLTEKEHQDDGRTFDITACDDIEIEEIDGELH